MAVVLITGGARRIGKSLSINFAKKGYDVIINYNQSKDEAISLKNEILNLGVKCEIYKANVSNLLEVEQMFTEIENKNNELLPNILINNAGIFPQSTNFENLDEYTWHNTIDTNLSSQYYCASNFYKLVKKYNIPNARIINFSSLGAFEVWKGRTAYNVSKAGVNQLTKSLARDLAPLVCVNSVSPGTIDINSENTSDAPSEDLRISANRVPYGRYGNAEDIFDAVYFFATCSPFITGNNLNVDGAYSLSR
jgi:3-oxoacyl-[acyl-carrier protein] reductase